MEIERKRPCKEPNGEQFWNRVRQNPIFPIYWQKLRTLSHSSGEVVCKGQELATMRRPGFEFRGGGKILGYKRQREHRFSWRKRRKHRLVNGLLLHRISCSFSQPLALRVRGGRLLGNNCCRLKAWAFRKRSRLFGHCQSWPRMPESSYIVTYVSERVNYFNPISSAANHGFWQQLLRLDLWQAPLPRAAYSNALWQAALTTHGERSAFYHRPTNNLAKRRWRCNCYSFAVTS